MSWSFDSLPPRYKAQARAQLPESELGRHVGQAKDWRDDATLRAEQQRTLGRAVKPQEAERPRGEVQMPKWVAQSRSGRLNAHKYGAVATERDGQRFASKAEARRYDALKLLQASGEVVFFLRQVPFHLPGGVTYRADYMVFWSAGHVTVEDVKGVIHPTFTMKKKLVESLYPVVIELVS